MLVIRPHLMITLLLLAGCGPKPKLDSGSWATLEVPDVLSRPEVVWDNALPSPPVTFLDAGENQVLVLSHRGDIYIIGLEHGNRLSRLWQPVKSAILAHALDTASNTFYFASPGDEELNAYSLERGKRTWTAPGDGIVGSMVLLDGHLYATGLDGNLTAFNLRSGKVVAQLTFAGRFYRGIQLANSHLLALNDQGILFAFSPIVIDSTSDAAAELEVIWRRNLSLKRTAVIQVHPDAVVAADSKGRLLIIDPGTGAVRHNLQLEAPIYATPVVAGGYTYVGAADGSVAAINIESGAVYWTAQGEGLIKQPLRFLGIGPSKLLVSFERGSLSAYDLDSGQLLWSYEHTRPLKTIGLAGGGILVADVRNRLTYLHPAAAD